MANNTITDLEASIVAKGFTLSKEYDETKGICKVIATSRGTNTVIKSQNTSRADLWNAYRRALEFILNQLNQFEKVAGRGI